MARELAGVLNEAQTSTPVVLAVLTQVGELFGEHAASAVEIMLGGPHDSFTMHLLLGAGVLDPAGIEPERLLRVGIHMLAVAYEVGGLEDLLDAMAAGDPDQDAQLATIEKIWRIDYPRGTELLEAITAHHPDKRVAKPARKALLRHCGWLASRQCRRCGARLGSGRCPVGGAGSLARLGV